MNKSIIFLDQCFTLAIMNFKLRNEGSYLGIIWYLLNPLLMFVLLLVIFSGNLGGDIDHYPIYLLIGIIMFNFFLASTTESTKLIKTNKGTIKSIPYRREVLIGSVVLVTLFSHIFEIFLLGLAMILFDISPIGLVSYFLVIVPFSLFTLGASMILAATAVYFVDLDNIWAFASRLLWLATPIFYSIQAQKGLEAVISLNPLFFFMTLSRDLTISHTVPGPWIIIGTLAYTLGALAVGSIVFGISKKRFAEMI